MSKNKSIVIIVFIVLIVFLKFNLKKSEIQNSKEINIENKESVQVLYDEETSLYYIKNEETNEIIYASQNEEDLKFYKENPDYNPNPIDSNRTTDLREFIPHDIDRISSDE